MRAAWLPLMLVVLLVAGCTAPAKPADKAAEPAPADAAPKEDRQARPGSGGEDDPAPVQPAPPPPIETTVIDYGPLATLGVAGTTFITSWNTIGDAPLPVTAVLAEGVLDGPDPVLQGFELEAWIGDTAIAHSDPQPGSHTVRMAIDPALWTGSLEIMVAGQNEGGMAAGSVKVYFTVAHDGPLPDAFTAVP